MRIDKLHPCADWSEGESTSETVSDKPESDVLYCYATSEPRVVGALIMGIKGDRWPRRRCKSHAFTPVAAKVLWHACIPIFKKKSEA